jgi:hypothetical protein
MCNRAAIHRIITRPLFVFGVCTSNKIKRVREKLFLLEEF